MPKAKANGNGTYEITRDDGKRFTSPILPEGVEVEQPKPPDQVIMMDPDGTERAIPVEEWIQQGRENDPPAGRYQMLLPRNDGRFDVVKVENWGGQVGHTAGVADGPTAIRLRDEKGYQVMGDGALAELADSNPDLFRALKAARGVAKPGPTPEPTALDKLKQGAAAVAERLTAPWSPETYRKPAQASAAPAAAPGPQGPSLESFFQPPAQASAAPAAVPGPQAASGSAISSAVPSFKPAGAGAGMRELQKAKDMQAAAVAEAATVGQQRAAADEAAVDTQLAAARERELQAQQREERRTRAMADAETGVRQAMDQLTTATGEPDPNRWWNTRTTGGKVSAFVASFLSGFIGKTDPIQQAIEQDLQLQREGYERQRTASRDRYTAATQLYGLMRERFQDDEVAARAAEERAAQYAVLEGRKIAARFAAPEAKAAAAERLAQLEAWHVDKRNALREAAANRALQAYEIETRRQGQEMNFAVEMARAGGKAAGPTVPAGEASQVGQYDAALAQLDNLAKEHGLKTGKMSWLTKHLPGTDATKYEDLRRVAAQGIGYILEGGKLTESDLERYMAMLPESTDGLDRANNKVEAIRRDIVGRKTTKLQGLGRAGYNVQGFQDEMPVASGRPK